MIGFLSLTKFLFVVFTTKNFGSNFDRTMEDFIETL